MENQLKEKSSQLRREKRVYGHSCAFPPSSLHKVHRSLTTLLRNYKPTESDLEDDSDDEEDEDPSTWFEDDQDDGRKGQDIVEPDVEDFSDIIRVDRSRIHYNTLDQGNW